MWTGMLFFDFMQCLRPNFLNNKSKACMFSQNKIKALWICSWYPSRKFPNLANFTERQAKATADLSDITVLYVVGDAVSDYETAIEEGSFLVVRVYFPETSNTILRAIRQFRAQLLGYKTVLGIVGKPDIVHVQSLFPAAIFALYLDFFKKIPFVVTEHYGGYLQYAQFIQNKVRLLFTRFVFQHAQMVFGLSNDYIQALKNLGLDARQFKILYNVVDTQLFKPNFDKSNDKASVFHFTNMSTFDDHIKNISGIIRSATKLAAQRQDFAVDLVGNGADEEQFIQLAESLGVLNKQVFFKGYLFEHEVARHLQQSNCLIMFSNIESQSVVTLEAASVGLPIIATKTCGIGERVTPETGVLLDIGDEAGLVKAMNYVMDNRGKYDPSVIRSKIVDKCSIEVVGKAIVSVYEEVLNLKYRDFV